MYTSKSQTSKILDFFIKAFTNSFLPQALTHKYTISEAQNWRTLTNYCELFPWYRLSDRNLAIARHWERTHPGRWILTHQKRPAAQKRRGHSFVYSQYHLSRRTSCTWNPWLWHWGYLCGLSLSATLYTVYLYPASFECRFSESGEGLNQQHIRRPHDKVPRQTNNRSRRLQCLYTPHHVSWQKS